MPLNEASKKGNITNEEAATFAKHFEDPRFRELFQEYAKEISDPKAKAEHDAYLAQVEAEGQAEAIYGKGVQLIVPEPGVVIKTKDSANDTRIYINVCTSSKIDKFSLEQSKDPARPGRQLLLPSALHSRAPKVSTATDGGAVHVWDWAVHPDALQEAAQQPSLMDMMSVIALERVEEAAGIKLVRRYKLLQLNYKAVEGHDRPAVMSVRSGRDSEVVDGRIKPKANAQTAPVTSSCNSSISNAPRQQKASRSSFSFGAGHKQPNGKQHKLPTSTSTSTPGYIHQSGAVTPHWELVERGSVDLAQTWQDGRLGPARPTPQALVLRVKLPGVASATAVQLDVSSKGLQLEVPGKYVLQVQLQHSVKDQQGTAKFDKEKQQLTITLPVIQPDMTNHLTVQRQEDVELPETPALQQSQYQLQQVHHQAQDKEETEQAIQQQAIVAEASGSNGHTVTEDILEAATAEVEPSTPCASGTGIAAVITVVGDAEQADKTANQLLWEQLHTRSDIEQSQQDQQVVCAMQAPLQQQQAKAGVTAAPPPSETHSMILKPRLQSRKVTVGMLD